MDSEKVMKRDGEYVLHTYNRSPVVLEKGHGLYAEGPEGQKYLDFTSGIGVNSLGYCDLAWAEAVSQQAHKLQHTSNLYYTAPCGKLAKKLCKRTGMSKVFFGNSGAEANEGAIKAARKYSVDHYGKDRYNVITLVNSFHGRTLATLTATGQEVFHNYFGPFNEGFQYVPAGDIEALRELVDRHTCAVMMELIQGEGGVMALDPDYVQAVRALCDEKDLVLIVDEVQTGVGRTGTFLCCEHYNLKPDIVTLAKGLGGGLPIGAVLLNEKTAEGMGPGTHGSTFGGNPVVCAGAKSILDLGLTLEYLETQGVPVLGLRTDELPAFYCRTSGFKLDYNCKDEETVAKIMKAKWDIGLKGGAVVGNPIPEQYAMDPNYMNGIIDKAVAQANAEHIHGKAITPYLLAHIKDMTEGKSFAANLELAYNNAHAASKIAVAYTKL